MSSSAAAPNVRILLIDDLRSIHDDFARILTRPSAGGALESLASDLFGQALPATHQEFELDSAFQGKDGLAKLKASLQQHRPYAVAFVDMRMPPGWDGLETIEHLWRSDPQLQVVVCTAYSDYPWNEVIERLHAGQNLLILKKPFDPAEVMQLASVLASKWTAERRLHDMIATCVTQPAARAAP